MEYEGQNKRKPENGDGRRSYDCKNCAEHSGHEIRLNHLENEQVTIKEGLNKTNEKIDGMQKTMLTTAITGVIAMLALVGNLILKMLSN